MRTIPILALLCLAVRAEDGGAKSLGQATAVLEQALSDGDVNKAMATLIGMPALYPKAEDADRKAAIKMIGKAAKAKDLRVRHGAFAALGEIKAKGSSKLLGKWLKPPKKFKGEIPESYGEAIRAAGKIADTSTLSTLRKLSDHAELTIAVRATEALGGYHTLPLKRRKSLSFDLVKRLQLLSAPPGRRGGWRPEERMRKGGLAAATTKALQGITGKPHSTAEGWKRWMEQAERQRDPFQ